MTKEELRIYHRNWYLKRCQNQPVVEKAVKKAPRKISDSEKYIPGRKTPYMDDAEIVYRYRSALHPAKQINILAQLNDVSAAKIISVLERNGIEIRKKAK